MYFQAEQQRIENYENFLKEQKTQKHQATWCEFPEAYQGQKKTNPFNNDQPAAKKKKKNKNKLIPDVQDNSVKNKEGIVEIKNTSTPAVSNEKGHTDNDNEKFPSKGQQTPNKKKKKNKNKNQNASKNPANQEESLSHHESNNIINKSDQQQTTPKKKNKKKLAGAKPERRKAIDENSFKLIINGKDVELVRYDGFPIMKKDAERLEELKKNMHRRGIPKSEIQRNMKLERRRAEKALARMKREVCYNCRKGNKIYKLYSSFINIFMNLKFFTPFLLNL